MAKTDRIEKWQHLPANTVEVSAVSGAGGGASGDADKVDGFDASATALPNTLLALNASSKLPADITGDADTVDGYDASDFLSPQYVVLALDGNLTAERVLTAGDGIDLTDAGAGSTVTVAVDLAAVSGLAFSSGELVIADSIAGAGLVIASKVLAVGAGDGLTVNANDVALTTPGTLSVSSSNVAAGNHTHGVTSSSSPGGAASILASAADGGLQLLRLGIGVGPDDDNYVSLVDGAVVGCPSGPRIVFDDTNDYFEMLAGDVGVRTSTPAAAMDVHKDTEQLRLTYASDTDKYAAFTVGSTGTVELAAVTNIVLDPGGNNVNPGGHIQDDLGAWNAMWRTGFLAELYVPNLVAQDVMATIGGRITVAPTTYLTSDVGSGDGSIIVEHNSLAIDDYVYFQASPAGTPQFECMQITGGPTGAGPYTYTVDRDEDGSGANDWSEGAGVVNSGYSLNAGLIEITSTSTVFSHLGPVIAIYNREDTTWDGQVPVVALGNLDSFLGYGTVYGLAMGNDLTEAAPTSDAFKGATLDRADGLRLFNTNLELYDSSTPKVRILHDYGIAVSSGTLGPDTTVFMAYFGNSGLVPDVDAGDVIIGTPFHTTGSSQIGLHWDNSALALKIKRATLELYNGATQTVSIQPDGDVQIGSNIAAVGTTVFQVFAVAQTYDSESMGAGDILIGDHGNANVLWDESAGQLKFRGGTTTEAYIDTDGTIVGGANNVTLNSDGIQVQLYTGSEPSVLRSYQIVDDSGNVHGLLGAFTSGHVVMLHATGTDSGTSPDLDLRATSESGGGGTAEILIGAYAPTGGAIPVYTGMNFVATDGSPDVRTITALADTMILSVNSLYLNETANGEQTIGLTINQDANTDEILTLKNSEVAHGMTARTETDSFFTINPKSGTLGGASLRGWSESVVGLWLTGAITTDDTDKTSSAEAAVVIRAVNKTTTSYGSMGANANLMSITNHTTTKFLFDAEGSAHAEIEWTTFDEHDDVALLTSLERNLVEGFGGWADDNRELLERVGVIQFGAEPGRGMLNTTKLLMLLTGGIRQVASRQDELEQKVLEGV